MGTRFVLRRLLSAILVMLAVSFFTYALLEAAPGDAAQVIAGDVASQAELSRLRAELGLDQPLPLRYLRFLEAAVLHGDLGRSVMSNQNVAELLADRFAQTALLALTAMLLALVVGMAAGITAARRPGSLTDAAVMGITGLGISLPTYWVALLLVMVVSLRWGWLPAVGAGTPAHLILPAITLALPTAAVVARLTRSGVLDVKAADYVRTARGKGLTRHQVWRDHILRNSLLPVVTMMGLHLGHLLGGAFVIETIYAWPGLGRMVVQAVFDRDFPVLVGATLLIALVYQLLNLAVDMLHAWLDPRVGQTAV